MAFTAESPPELQTGVAWQVAMDAPASLSHTHNWHEVGMVKVPATVDPTDPNANSNLTLT